MNDRLADAQASYNASQRRVATTPEPAGQKFPVGSKVRIADDLGERMRHFESGVDATVVCTYAHAYQCDDERALQSYTLNVDGRGTIAWYYEHQLTAIPEDKQ